jgi:hypothetical protein
MAVAEISAPKAKDLFILFSPVFNNENTTEFRSVSCKQEVYSFASADVVGEDTLSMKLLELYDGLGARRTAEAIGTMLFLHQFEKAHPQLRGRVIDIVSICSALPRLTEMDLR